MTSFLRFYAEWLHLKVRKLSFVYSDEPLNPVVNRFGVPECESIFDTVVELIHPPFCPLKLDKNESVRKF
jgi:hypothetical protein